jgi:hypothetical protein
LTHLTQNAIWIRRVGVSSAKLVIKPTYGLTGELKSIKLVAGQFSVKHEGFLSFLGNVDCYCGREEEAKTKT